MEKRINLEKRGRQPSEITELNLDNCHSIAITGLTDEFVNLQQLSLIGVGLTNLKGFPKLPKLTKLELSDNKIAGGLNYLHTSPELKYLNLSGNRISELDELQPLKEFKHLESLDLFNNEATKISNYKEVVFTLIPSLKYLDGFDINDKELDDSEEEEEEEEEEDEVNGNDSEDGEDEDEEAVDEEEGHLEEDIEDADDDDDDVSLGAVYKDNLEEESEGDDYVGESGEEEEEEDDDFDIEEGDESFDQKNSKDKDNSNCEEQKDKDSSKPKSEDVQARGKKRKHEADEVN